MIATKDKKEFVRWFLGKFQLKRRESVWILNYVINHDTLLDNVHFIESGAKYCPRSIVMSTHCSKSEPFRFYKNQTVTTDAEKSFHDVRLNKKDPIYIQLNFKDKNDFRFLEVLEENPFLPEDLEQLSEYSELAEKFLNEIIIKKQIDKALDNRNEDLFMELSSKLIN